MLLHDSHWNSHSQLDIVFIAEHKPLKMASLNANLPCITLNNERFLIYSVSHCHPTTFVPFISGTSYNLTKINICEQCHPRGISGTKEYFSTVGSFGKISFSNLQYLLTSQRIELFLQIFNQMPVFWLCVLALWML